MKPTPANNNQGNADSNINRMKSGPEGRNNNSLLWRAGSNKTNDGLFSVQSGGDDHSSNKDTSGHFDINHKSQEPNGLAAAFGSKGYSNSRISKLKFLSTSFFGKKTFESAEARLTMDFPVQEANQQPEIRKLDLPGIGATPVKKNNTLMYVMIMFLIFGGAVAVTVVLNSLAADEEGLCGSSEVETETRDTIASTISILDNSVVVADAFLNCVPTNAFDTLNDDQVQAIQDAEAFSMERLGINELDGAAFRGIVDFTQVKRLSMSSNGLSSLKDNVFNKYFDNVESIDLSNNAFTVLENNVFADLPKLTDIDFTGNSFTILPVAIKQATSLETISFVNCNSLIEITPGFFLNELPNLVSINFSGTNIVNQYGGTEELFKDFTGLADNVNLIF